VRSLETILLTGPVNSDESRAVRDAGFLWKACRWCTVVAFVSNDEDGLCRPCQKARGEE
jgi:hypothetical protein